MATVFIVFANDGTPIRDNIQDALARKNNRIRVLPISQSMRGINPQPLQQAIESSDIVVLLFTPAAVASNVREFESAFNHAGQQGKTIYPVQIDGIQLPNYVNLHSFPIDSGNQAGIDDLVNDILRDIYPPFGWWRKLSLSGKALLSGLVVFLALLFAFFALFSDEDRRIFFCNLFSDRLPSCESEAILSTEVAFPPSKTPNPSDTLVPTDILIATNTPESPTPTSISTETPKPPTPIPGSVSIPCGQLLFAENFDHGFPPNWVADPGKWTILSDNGNPVFQMMDEGIKTVQLGADTWDNYALEFEVKPLSLNSGESVIVDLRMSPKFNNRITFLLDFAFKVVYLYELSALDIGVPRRIALRTYSFSENSWLKVRIELKDQQVRLYLNGDSRISFNDIDPTIFQGIIQLKSSSPSVLFDNISLSSLENCPA